MITNDLSNVKEKYELLEVLGSGSFGVVRKCRNRKTGELAAVKTIEKAHVEDPVVLRREIELLKEVHHPNVIELYDVYEDNFSIHLVTELCTGGELYDKVIEYSESEEQHFSEEDAGIIIRDILDGIRYIHDELNIVHRDLKPENFLLKNKEDGAPVKIIDFGLSRKNDALFGLMTTRVGTPYYVAPEVLSGNYTIKCDIWSIGVIAYILLCGFAPFEGNDDLEIMRQVQTAPLEFPSPEWDEISVEAKDFIKSLLQREAFERPTAAEALELPWVAKHQVKPGVPAPQPFSSIRSNSISANELRLSSARQNAFQKFLAVLKMKKAMKGVAHVLTPQEASTLGSIFSKIDKDNDGIISPRDLDEAVASESFSIRIKQNLLDLKSQLSSNPRYTFDIRPYLGFVNRRAQSDSNVQPLV